MGVPGIWSPNNAGLGSELLGSLEGKLESENLGFPVGRVYESENVFFFPGEKVTRLGIWDGGAELVSWSWRSERGQGSSKAPAPAECPGARAGSLTGQASRKGTRMRPSGSGGSGAGARDCSW